MSNFEWEGLIISVIVGVAVSYLFSFAVNLRLSSSRVSTSMRVAYGIYIAVVTFFISVMRRGESLSFGDVWIIFAYILIPAFLYIIMKGAMNKSVKNSDIEMKTLNDISDEPTREQFQVMHVFHSFFPWFKNRK